MKLLHSKKCFTLAKIIFVAILLPHHHRKGDMRQPDMAFVLCQESSHLQAGAGCSGAHK
jgi:hypothetical protein